MGISLTLRSDLPSALPRPQTYPSEAVAHALCADPIFVVGDLATEGGRRAAGAKSMASLSTTRPTRELLRYHHRAD